MTVRNDLGIGEEPSRPAQIGPNPAAFGAADPRTPSDAAYHFWHVELDTAHRYRIRMESSAVDSMIDVFGPDSFAAHNDDASGQTVDAQVEFIPPRAGSYAIRTTTYAAGELGPYTLIIEPRSADPVGQAFELGTTVDANLSGAESQLYFRGEAGAIVELRVTSRAFDTVASLSGPGGESWVNDDANDLGDNGDERALDSTIVAALPRSGFYQLAVTPYGRGAGPFRVRSSVRAPVTIGEDGRRPDGLAGPDGGGRLLGVYTGVTEYQHQPPLYGCADDARMLARAMRETHLQDERDQLVLPDSLATRAGFLAAIAQMAEQAGPNDVALIFFSGHGQQTPDEEDGDELDGLDETIVFHDGSMTDDEFVTAVSSINAGRVIVALDSCHAGGFADDWVSEPGRIGLFSSDEDVLSDTAQPHNAGGYLSWHLRQGVLGHGDWHPRDGVMHAGELTDFIYSGFVDDHALINAPNNHEPQQRLVVRRGSVRWGDVLWVYPRNRDLSLPDRRSIDLTTVDHTTDH